MGDQTGWRLLDAQTRTSASAVGRGTQSANSKWRTNSNNAKTYSNSQVVISYTFLWEVQAVANSPNCFLVFIPSAYYLAFTINEQLEQTP